MIPTKHTPQKNFPYTIGVILAINAISDAFLLLDAPDCGFWKITFIQGSHDWYSTLLDVEGFHRVHVTCVNTENIVTSRVDDLAERMRSIARQENCGAVLAVGFPMATISGTQFDAIWRSLKPSFDKPFFQIPGGAMTMDWLDGYAQTINAIARGLELPKVPVNPDDVGIVGYMMDRNEYDHKANIIEIRRILAGIGLNIVSLWPNGGKISDMKSIASAGTIISLPYAREAAATIAERLGVPNLECGLPFGLQGTSDWLMGIAQATGKTEKARTFIESELSRIAPRLKWIVTDHFLHKKALFYGDPMFIRPLAQLLEELGARIELAVAVAGEHHLKSLEPLDDLRFPVFAGLSRASLLEKIRRVEEKGNVQLFIGSQDNSGGDLFSSEFTRIACVELGFSSFHTHAIHDSPYFGYEGCLCFLNRVLNEFARLT